jgi:hypothetical protein
MVPRRDRRDIARVWLTAPCRPIRCRLSRDRTTWPGVPSFFSAYEVSCRVRAERVKPYASYRWRFTPRTETQVRVGPPPPGATRELGVSGYAVVTTVVYAQHAQLSTLCGTDYSQRCADGAGPLLCVDHDLPLVHRHPLVPSSPNAESVAPRGPSHKSTVRGQEPTGTRSFVLRPFPIYRFTAERRSMALMAQPTISSWWTRRSA